jgi:hypothetical protein
MDARTDQTADMLAAAVLQAHGLTALVADRAPYADRRRIVVDDVTCPTCGRESCEGHDRSAVRDRSRAERLLSLPDPPEVVEGVVWGGCITVLVGESSTGKSFVGWSLAAAVSADRAWLGREATHGSVVYVPYEGDALGRRLRALRDVQHATLDHIYVPDGDRAPLSPRVSRDGSEEPSIGERALAQYLGDLTAELHADGAPPVRLVVIDTVRASMAGNEDASGDVSAYLRAVRRIISRAPEAACLLLHHAGWQDGDSPRKRERGSSAWRGNCDATLYLEADDPADDGTAALRLRTLKTRDAERPPVLHMVRRRVELAASVSRDIRRGPVTSCVIEPDHRSRADIEAAERAETDAATLAIDLRVLRVIADRPQAATSQGSIRLAVGDRRDVVYAAIARLMDRGWVEPPTKQRRPYTVTAAGAAALDGASHV